jgi:Flp pilus assembly protein TadG
MRSRFKDARGATAVEFALVMLPLIYLVFGIIQYGLYFYSTQTGTYAVQQGVRRLSVGDCTSTPTLQAMLSNKLSNGATTASASALNPQVQWKYTDATGAAATANTVSPPTGLQVGDSVSLTLTYPALNMNFPFIPLPNGGQVTRTSSAMVEDTTSSGACA